MRVLVIEDEAKIATFIKRGLKEEGFAVDVTGSAEEGHFLATTNDYDLLTIDVMLPKMDGFTLCEKLRKDGVKSIIIMLSVKDEVKDKVRGLDMGADDYLSKPFDFDELLARIRAQLRKKQGGDPSYLEVADLKLNLITHEVKRGNKTIALTAREFSLLEYLMRHVDRLVTRTMIAEHVWDVHFDSSSNVINVFINYLRQKIDDGHLVKLIRTVHGRGYMLKAH